MSEKPQVTTAAELDAMSPAGRDEHFQASIVRGASLTSKQRDQLFARMDAAAASNRGGARRAS